CADKALAEIHRVLKPGGRLYLSVPFFYPIHDAPYDFLRFTIHGLHHLFQANKFSVIREVAQGNFLITIMQLINLIILTTVRDIGKKNLLLGLITGLLAYPLCLINNMLAIPLLLLTNTNFQGACLGYFIIAQKD
ncbi:hypothetical protein TI04_07295, partial [Achromatium sp. WMS2]